jgi:hypothetical protein
MHPAVHPHDISMYIAVKGGIFDIRERLTALEARLPRQ